jgi:glycosyltransferase involved in cell wall biosynthesis
MKIVQSTWVRYHHFDLARELQELGHLERIFTCLPWWKADKESREQNIPRDKISCNFLLQGTRRMGRKMPGYSPAIDAKLAEIETKFFSRWVANSIGECDTYIAISGSGLHAGRKVKRQGSGYVMDRGSTQIRHADQSLGEEYRRWNLHWNPVNPWLIENEEAEAEEAHLITVPSSFVRDTFIKQGTPAEKLRIVPYGVSLQEFHPVGEPEPGIFRLVFVGQLSIRKGAPYLLKAFREFQHPKKELVVVGAVAEEIRPLIQQLGTEHVRFVGAVPRSEVKRYLSTAHAMVLPSIEEGLALVQGQALACGCPVIATPNTGSETLFSHEKEGLIVKERDVKSLVEAFTRLSEDTDLRTSMRHAALERVKDLGGWKTYGRQMLAVAEEAKKLAQAGSQKVSHR